MTIDDVERYSEDEKKKIIASYPAHEAEARIKGIPVLGSGRVFPISEGSISIEHREFPGHWPRIGGMDFGWDHPFAAVELVWDRDTDTVYVSRTHRLKEAPRRCEPGARNCAGLGPVMATGKPWKVPALRWRSSTATSASAHYVEGNGQKSVSVEAGLMDLLQRMESGRFKVFREHNDWWEEFRLYQRKDGKVVKEGDDLMAATRYAVMSLRHASTVASYRNFRRKLVYPKTRY